MDDPALSAPPFVQVEGLINLRDIGGYPIVGSPGQYVKTKHVYRSGEPSRITGNGKAVLIKLVNTVFDLRSEKEVVANQTTLTDVESIRTIRVPVSEQDAYDPVSLQTRVQAFALDDREAFAKLYAEILEVGGKAFEKIFIHLRDQPTDPCLVHCTAGKDRTGIFVALLLSMLRVSDEDIIRDYSLTTIGLRPALPLLVARFEKQPIFKENPTGTMNMAKSEPESMRDVLKVLKDKFGGAEAYLETHTQLRKGDFEKIRKNLVMIDPLF